ncbi:hypothetical protein LSH36_676g01046 [Paralvinella palmiformis]|uniref:Uncharacterized protein n=1 Tax=Paralvinella palmiformis TaxID=53620 RepID=A0AAD9J395_9ANNE|nr:hypothetical protein LSH36_676g01046 [Paralvinella palmiformis]
MVIVILSLEIVIVIQVISGQSAMKNVRDTSVDCDSITGRCSCKDGSHDCPLGTYGIGCQQSYGVGNVRGGDGTNRISSRKTYLKLTGIHGTTFIVIIVCAVVVAIIVIATVTGTIICCRRRRTSGDSQTTQDSANVASK